MTHAEEQQNVRRLANDELAALEEWRREWRMVDALAIKHSHHRGHTAASIRLARDINVAFAKLFEHQADELSASLNGGPIVQLIPHGGQPACSQPLYALLCQCRQRQADMCQTHSTPVINFQARLRQPFLHRCVFVASNMSGRLIMDYRDIVQS